jgi:hypothetical protein
MRRALKIVGIVLAAIAVLLVGAILIVPPILTKGPMPEALPAMESSATVTVDDGRPITFTPAEATSTGLIIYPGAFVEPRSYAPAAKALAEAGSFVAIVPMPFSLAILGSNRADGVIEAHPEISEWTIAGHSLGGVMAAGYANDHRETIGGLALWAAYPQDGVDLTAWTGEVASIFGTRDGLTTVGDIENSRPQLPEDTAFVAVDGGNHAYFGWYGDQRGDNPATITREEQQRIVIDATADVVRSVAGDG